eukprot:m.183726 g.183726  ORF g.183726 m.183726 type:complete len:530 (+) comp17480_c0_seq2:26-1615(+)
MENKRMTLATSNPATHARNNNAHPPQTPNIHLEPPLFLFSLVLHLLAPLNLRNNEAAERVEPLHGRLLVDGLQVPRAAGVFDKEALADTLDDGGLRDGDGALLVNRQAALEAFEVEDLVALDDHEALLATGESRAGAEELAGLPEPGAAGHGDLRRRGRLLGRGRRWPRTTSSSLGWRRRHCCRSDRRGTCSRSGSSSVLRLELVLGLLQTFEAFRQSLDLHVNLLLLVHSRVLIVGVCTCITATPARSSSSSGVAAEALGNVAIHEDGRAHVCVEDLLAHAVEEGESADLVGRHATHPGRQHDDDSKLVQRQEESKRGPARVGVGEALHEGIAQAGEFVLLLRQPALRQRGGRVRPVRRGAGVVLVLLLQQQQHVRDLLRRGAVELQVADNLQRGDGELFDVLGRAGEADVQLAWQLGAHKVGSDRHAVGAAHLIAQRFHQAGLQEAADDVGYEQVKVIEAGRQREGDADLAARVVASVDDVVDNVVGEGHLPVEALEGHQRAVPGAAAADVDALFAVAQRHVRRSNV